MKILLICEFFPDGKELKFSGGVETRSLFLAKNLAKNNQVFVITSRYAGSPLSQKNFNFQILRVGPERSYSPTVGNLIARIKFIRAAIGKGKALDADIVDGSNFITHFIGKRIAAAKRIPSVAWYPDVWLGSWIKNAGLFGLFGAILEFVNLKSRFDCYIAISKSTATKLKKYINKTPHVIPCGVDKQEFLKKEKKYPIPTIICISRLTKYKNIQTLVLAFAKILKNQTAQLIIVGLGPELTTLKRLTEKLNCKTKVKFLSNLPRRELVKAIKSSHVFCLPSTVEGFGISVIESIAAGLPYVISDIEVLREITENGKGGFLFNPQDPEDLAAKLSLLLANPTIYDSKVKEGQPLLAKYDWAKISHETEKVYKEAL